MSGREVMKLNRRGIRIYFRLSNRS